MTSLRCSQFSFVIQLPNTFISPDTSVEPVVNFIATGFLKQKGSCVITSSTELSDSCNFKTVNFPGCSVLLPAWKLSVSPHYPSLNLATPVLSGLFFRLSHYCHFPQDSAVPPIFLQCKVVSMIITAFAQSLSGVLAVVHVQDLLPWCAVQQMPHPGHGKKNYICIMYKL